MTSSLVGSEMCIRDRSGLLWGDSASRYNGTILPQKHWQLLTQHHLSSSCLLYTSDAADDM
eukprot:8418892-Prorocentrum_lima.AAC.1